VQLVMLLLVVVSFMSGIHLPQGVTKTAPRGRPSTSARLLSGSDLAALFQSAVNHRTRPSLEASSSRISRIRELKSQRRPPDPSLMVEAEPSETLPTCRACAPLRLPDRAAGVSRRPLRVANPTTLRHACEPITELRPRPKSDAQDSRILSLRRQGGSNL